jgi:RES domain-containing protein
MALVWRLVRPEFASDLDGQGNVNRGARWNSPGRGVVYASFNLSLCVLESFVQLPIALLINLPEMAAVRIEIPDDTSSRDIQLADLPSDLAGEQTGRRCRELGDEWLTTAEHLVLTAPSFIMPQERNLMLNPAHPLMAKVKVVSTERFRFDPRLAARAA